MLTAETFAEVLQIFKNWVLVINSVYENLVPSSPIIPDERVIATWALLFISDFNGLSCKSDTSASDTSAFSSFLLSHFILY